jgi:filamentous hemagglutinin
VISSSISTAIGGGSFGDNLGAALVGEAGNVAMATGFDWIGDTTIKFPEGSLEKVVAHALMGGLLSQAMGGDFATGAAAAGLNEVMMNQLISLADGNDQLQVMMSQLTGLVAAAAVDGDLQQGANIAGNATTYNYLYHREVKEMLAEMDSKETEEEKRAVRDKYEALDNQREAEREELCKRSPGVCKTIAHDLADDDQKLTTMIAELRREGRGGAAVLVGRVLENNLGSANSMAADIKGAEGGIWTKLAAGITTLGTAIFPGKGGGKVGSPPKDMSPPGAGRSGAFNEAKRQSGIPTSQQPSRVLPNVDKRGNPQPGSIYEFEVPTSGGGMKTVRIRDDAGGHDFGDGNSQNRGPHFNDQPGNHYDY